MNLLQHFILKTAEQEAQTTIYCAVSEEMEGMTGLYLADCKIQQLKNHQATDGQAADKLWEMSSYAVGEPEMKESVNIFALVLHTKNYFPIIRTSFLAP